MDRFAMLLALGILLAAGPIACDRHDEQTSDAATVEESDADRSDPSDDPADDAAEAAEDRAEDAKESDIEDAADDVGDVIDDAEEDVSKGVRDATD